jgi:hypothetical protein
MRPASSIPSPSSPQLLQKTGDVSNIMLLAKLGIFLEAIRLVAHQ